MIREDIDAVYTLALGSLTAPHWPVDGYRKALGGESKRIALVAETPACGLAGFCMAAVIAPEAELESIVVHPEERRQGVARALLNDLSGRLKQSASSTLFLEVRASNHAALAFYAASGFSQVGRRRGYYVDAEEDALVLRLAL